MSKPDTKIKSFQLSEGKTSVFQIGLILLVALFFIGLVWLGGWGVDREIEKSQVAQKELSGTEKELKLQEEVADFNKDIEIPKKFPKDLPIIGEANIIEVYVYNPDTKDITTVFDSKRSVKENFDYYSIYAKNNGWQIEEARIEQDEKIGKLLIKKDDMVITFAFEKGENNNSKITISSTSLDKIPNLDINADDLTDFLNKT